MTANEKNRLIGIAFFVTAAINLILQIRVLVAAASISNGNIIKGSDFSKSLESLMLFMTFINIPVLIFVAVVGVLIIREYSKIRILALVAAIILAFYLPLGTLISIFAFWFFTSEEGYNLYQEFEETENPRQSIT